MTSVLRAGSLSDTGLVLGLVLEAHGKRVTVRLLSHSSHRTESGQTVDATLRGKIRLEGLKSTNPVCCGDQVNLHFEAETGDWTVESVVDRRNHMVRKATNLARQTHALAANLDQVWIVNSLAEPRFSPGFADRIALTAAAFSLPCHLIFNKSDQWSPEDLEAAQQWKDIYAAAAMEVYFCSALHGDGVGPIREAMRLQTQLLTGYSGAGKSSLLNALFPGLNARTGAISRFSGKGTHTTTTATLYEPEEGTRLIDSPGIKEWGVLDLETYEIAYHFKEIRDLAPFCRFPNCSHTHEPSCAVLDALREGKMASPRYLSYLSILNNEDQYR